MQSSIDNSIYENLPFSMPQVIQPSFPDYTVNIKDFGAQADGKTLNTQAINDAIKAVHEKGGGKVVIPEGLWLTGPIELQSNVNLYTEKNALVLFTDDFQAYPIIKPRSKDWKHAVASRPFRHETLKTSPSQAMACSTARATAGALSRKAK